MKIKTKIKKGLRKIGLDISRYENRLPTPVTDNIEEAIRSSKIGRPMAYNAQLAELRTVNGFSLGGEGWHPFAALTKQLLASPNIGYNDSNLKAFYQCWTPKNSHEALLGVNAPKKLRQLPPFTLHHPMQDLSPEERSEFMLNNIEDENIWSGIQGVKANEGYGLQGPISERKGKIEFNRIRTTLNSILKYGYDRSQIEGDITAIAVLHNHKFFFLVDHGQHRSGILSGMNYTKVPIYISAKYDTNDLAHWCQVYRGYWSREEVLSYLEHLEKFDSLDWAKKRGLYY
jgi:hypothetical protein